MRLPVELQPGESVVLLVHRHWFFLVMPLTLTLLAMLAPPAILLTVVVRTDGPRAVDIIVVVASLAYLAVVTFVFLVGAVSFQVWPTAAKHNVGDHALGVAELSGPTSGSTSPSSTSWPRGRASSARSSCRSSRPTSRARASRSCGRTRW